MTRLLSTKQLPAFMGIVLAMILAISLVPLNALANDSLQTQAVEASGTSGTSPWELTGQDSGGALSIGPNGTLASFSASDKAPWTIGDRAKIVQSVHVEPGVKAGTSLYGMFQSCVNLTNADLQRLDTAGTENMDYMFEGCESLIEIQLSGNNTSFNTSNVSSMTGMFYGCKNLTSIIGLSSFNTQQVTDMQYMFEGCSALHELVFPASFDTRNVANMKDMFKNCSSLEVLDLSSFTTQYITNMKGMFDGCTSLKQVTIGKNFVFNECTLPANTSWRFEDGKTYTAEEIARDRNGIAGTYIKVGSDLDDNSDPGDNSGSGNNSSSGNNPSSGNNSGSSNSGSNTNTSNGSSKGINVYRLYNPNNGDHLYTTSVSERDWLRNDIGWVYEGVAWVSPEAGGEVYRLYNPNNGDHLYTTSASERDWLKNKIGWVYEGVSWHTAGSNGVPLYRLFNPNADVGCHLWTSSVSERDWLKNKIGWVYEEVAWYVLAK